MTRPFGNGISICVGVSPDSGRVRCHARLKPIRYSPARDVRTLAYDVTMDLLSGWAGEVVGWFMPPWTLRTGSPPSLPIPTQHSERLRAARDRSQRLRH